MTACVCASMSRSPDAIGNSTNFEAPTATYSRNRASRSAVVPMQNSGFRSMFSPMPVRATKGELHRLVVRTADAEGERGAVVVVVDAATALRRLGLDALDGEADFLDARDPAYPAGAEPRGALDRGIAGAAYPQRQRLLHRPRRDAGVQRHWKYLPSKVTDSSAHRRAMSSNISFAMEPRCSALRPVAAHSAALG